ncbi:MAG TPA: adenosine deaminase [Gemmatimonadales bacterium]|jgi:adenosine deaminase|nr:adenosine deaminase [Gemmatimonadales bacterium]
MPKAELTRELIGRLPKAELHVHLDSALRPTTMIELARQAKFALPTTDPDALRAFMLVDDAGSLEDYLARFEYTIPLLQTPEGIEQVSYEMVEDAARDQLRYLEVRYCPRLSTRGGLTMEAALEAELRGLARGERDFGVVTRVINCSLRHYPPEVSEAIARLSVAYRDRGVVAFDLAGGEAGRPPGIHQAAFDIAADGCLGVTVHAGEAAGAASIAEAVHRCHADRIGHGTRLYEDPLLRDYLRDRRLPIEINLTSNVQTRAVARAADHPVRGYLDAGLVVTLCTDGWLMTGVTLSDEYWLAHRELGFTRAEIDRCIVAGFASAFLPWPERAALVAQVTQELAEL